jgi:hypothetical protein
MIINKILPNAIAPPLTLVFSMSNPKAFLHAKNCGAKASLIYYQLLILKQLLIRFNKKIKINEFFYYFNYIYLIQI